VTHFTDGLLPLDQASALGDKGRCRRDLEVMTLSSHDRETLVAKLEELRPEFAKLMRQFGAHEPDFGPLMRLLMDDFMFMGYSSGVRMYKHKLTRRYLNIDEQGRTYRWDDPRNAYIPQTVASALAHTFAELEKFWGYGHESRRLSNVEPQELGGEE
jgi:hypothetical protein